MVEELLESSFIFRPGQSGSSKPLVGRESVQAALETALEKAVNGFASVHLLDGEAGAGKTMLMEWLLNEAARHSFRCVVAQPIEGEDDLSLAALTDVIRPLAIFLPLLHTDHREVLTAAVGGSGRASVDPLLLGSATLALLAAAAEDGPLLVAIDDAHWVDPVSGQALSFAIRRLLADRVVVVIAQRPTEQIRIRGPWDVLRLDGLPEMHVGRLLEAVSGVRPAASVIAQIREETSGNPFAVSHLANRLPAEALTGTAPLPMTLPLQEVARRKFSGLLRSLPERTRTALSVVAAAGSAAGLLAPAALAELGLGVADLAAAEEAGLLEGAYGALSFSHPLYRAAALEVAGAVGSRRAHAALAAVAHERDFQRYAWHRGLSVLGTDEDSAAVLEKAADLAERQAGSSASLGMRRLAFALSPPGPSYDRRQLGLACALGAAGYHSEARDHLEALEARPALAAEVSADAFVHLARLRLWDTPLDSQPVAYLIPDDLPPGHKAMTLAIAALRARNMAEFPRWNSLARAAHAEMTSLLPDSTRSPCVDDDIAETLFLLPTLSLVAEVDLVSGLHHSTAIDELIGRVRRLLIGAKSGEPQASAIRQGLATMLDDLPGSPAQTLTWTSALDCADQLLTLWLSAVRARPSSVAYLMLARTELAGWMGDMRRGLTAAERGIELSHEVGSQVLTGWTHVFVSRIYAAMADERGCLEHGAAAIEFGALLNEPGPKMWVEHARAQLLLSTDRAQEAVEALTPVAAYAESLPFRGVRALPWQPDYIEALVRNGRNSDAERVLDRWLVGMPAAPDEWHQAVISRCQVLVHGESYLDALEQGLNSSVLAPTPLEQARTQLVAGVALRRRRRPGASRSLLEAATATFTRLEAKGWLSMAARELSDRRNYGKLETDDFGLTPQEWRVVQEIISGATTREAAARLFCSAKTVEYHLGHVYAKLGIHSRAALAKKLFSTAVPSADTDTEPA
jgi:DNA-binding CsgD family transcriptional regulator